MRPWQRAQLALLLEVASTPKPGNVDRHREYPGLRFEHFLAGAVGAYSGLRKAGQGESIGAAFEDAVRGMAGQSGGNTQFGALLLLIPLVRAAAGTEGSVKPAAVSSIVESTSVEDASAFYRAFEYVDVAVGDPPRELEEFDVRLGTDAIPTIEEHEVSLYDIMELSAPVDGVAREWVTGFPRSFEGASRIEAREGSILDRAAGVFLELLAEEPDTFVAKQHNEQTAREVSERAAAVLAGDLDAESLGDEFVDAGINPGTTADVIAASLFLSQESGVVV